MSLPDLIEVVPLPARVEARVTVPGSKSITNRALVLAALAQGETVLQGALWSEDTQVMVEALQHLGFDIGIDGDPEEVCNRTILVHGLGGAMPTGGTPEKPIELFVGNAGTAARFLAAMVCLGHGVYRLHGVPRMHERPQAGLFGALRQLGYRIDSANDHLPALIHGTGPRPGRCQVSIAESSQFASALLLCAQLGTWQIEVQGENADESPYVEMTRQLVRQFPKGGGVFEVEPDASSGSYFVGANHLLAAPSASGQALGTIVVPGWPTSGWQIDAAFPSLLPLPKQLSREHDLGDSIMTAIVLGPFAGHSVRFTDLGRLRVQECERVVALRTELGKCGASVLEQEDTLTIAPGPLHGAEIDSYNDHRMAMCFAILGLKVSGIKINNPQCVKKTFPNFFQKLAAPPPRGLGAVLLDPRSDRALVGEDLFAH